MIQYVLLMYSRSMYSNPTIQYLNFGRYAYLTIEKPYESCIYLFFIKGSNVGVVAKKFKSSEAVASLPQWKLRH
jgi:hypothetical protein